MEVIARNRDQCPQLEKTPVLVGPGAARWIYPVIRRPIASMGLVYFPTFTPKTIQMQVSMPYMEVMGVDGKNLANQLM